VIRNGFIIHIHIHIVVVVVVVVVRTRRGGAGSELINFSSRTKGFIRKLIAYV